MPSSKSKSTVTTTTEQYDQRAVAESGAIAIGGGSQIEYIQEFGDNVAAAFDRLVEFASDAGQLATEQVTETTQALSQELARKQTLVPTALTNILPYMAVGLFVLAGLFVVKKK